MHTFWIHEPSFLGYTITSIIQIQGENQHMHLDFTDHTTTQPLLVTLFGYIRISWLDHSWYQKYHSPKAYTISSDLSVNKTEICLGMSAANNDILFKIDIWIIRTRITGSGLNSTLNTVCFLMFLNMLRSFLNNPDKKNNFFSTIFITPFDLQSMK